MPVTLSAAATQTVSYTTADGTATAPSDYATATGTLTFQPGETSEAIAVSVAADQTTEPDEALAVTLSSPVNASIARSTAAGKVTNDDVAPAATPGSYKGATQEGNYVFFTCSPTEPSPPSGPTTSRRTAIRAPTCPEG